MNVRAALKTQYHAALAMLREAIERCPDTLWDAKSDAQAIPFWHVVYHALFFTHLYLQSDEASFEPWEHHRHEYQCLDEPPWAPDRMPLIGEPYTREQMLDYWRFCDGRVDGDAGLLDLDATTCGFPWYRMPKLDHQMMTIRHLQHHVALLSGRLRQAAGIDVGWIGSR
jgi:hypothetical protein